MTVPELEVLPYEAEMTRGALASPGPAMGAGDEPPGAQDLDNRHYQDQRTWVAERGTRILQMPHTPTPLREIRLPDALAGLKLYIKDETAHPSQSHKHRLAEALFPQRPRQRLADQRSPRRGGVQRVDGHLRGVVLP
ncbi:hypothetical protein [Streptomyces kanasensis]|uniref:Tryptophan synthase beta chain-like PALP domain-containing protein n=1 Tax=Streptomyces kanasensis TaxID=936756 RepID=A0A100YAL0_9ACTN|nr:hypothetical protein [Streptomyces kanasensis]KUH40759.1 hypothetical protein ATE80_00840 [Streptomyces kanasensis]